MSKLNLDIDKILADNPSIDRDEFKNAQRFIAEIRKQGYKRAEYKLALPYTRPVRRASLIGDELD